MDAVEAPLSEVDDRTELARRLGALRDRRGLSVRDLARASGLPLGTVGGYLSGRHLPQPATVDQFERMLAALGVEPGEPMPTWVRPVQLLGGAALAAVAARSGGWTGVMLVGLACRVALDPNPLFYYGLGPVLGALIWDGARGGAGIPWTTWCAVAAFSVTPYIAPPVLSGAWRVAACAALVLVVLLWRGRSAPDPAPGHAVLVEAGERRG